MRYYNETTDSWYNEGDSLTLHIDTNTVFSGVPTAELLAEWGYEPYIEPTHEPTLEELKAAKIAEIQDYDSSDAVNGFYVNGMDAWFDKETRSNFRGSLSDAELLGETEVSVPIGGNIFTLPVQTAKVLLARIQRYADQCAIVTAGHVAAVNALETMQAVEEYDITQDYPDKLRFDL